MLRTCHPETQNTKTERSQIEDQSRLYGQRRILIPQLCHVSQLVMHSNMNGKINKYTTLSHRITAQNICTTY